MYSIKLFRLEHGGAYEWILASSADEAIKFYREQVISQDDWQGLVYNFCGRRFEHATYSDFISAFIKEEPMDKMVTWVWDNGDQEVESPVFEHIKSFLQVVDKKQLPAYFGSSEW